MKDKLTSILCYATIFGFAAAMLFGDREGARFHLNQALVLHIFGILCSAGSAVLIFALGGTLGGLLASFLSMVYFMFMLLGIMNAANDAQNPLPLIGNIQILK